MRNIDIIREVTSAAAGKWPYVLAGLSIDVLIHRAAMPLPCMWWKRPFQIRRQRARQLYLQPVRRGRRAGPNQEGEQLRHHGGGAACR
jgi:hypothetical protein